MFQVLVLLTFLGAGQETADLSRLGECVRLYWNLLQDGQRDAAMEFVAPESREHFMSRGEPPFRSWKLLEMALTSSTESRTTVSIERFIQGGIYDWKVVENWRWDGNDWKVQIYDPVKARKQLFQGPGQKPRSGKLDVVPQELRVHFLDRKQSDSLLILNGLDTTVRVQEFNYDRDRFEWVEPLDTLKPGTVGRLTLRYKGADTAKNQASEAILVLKHGSKESRFSVPINYNYVSPGARGLFGLSKSATEDLERNAPIAPKVVPPQLK